MVVVIHNHNLNNNDNNINIGQVLHLKQEIEECWRRQQHDHR